MCCKFACMTEVQTRNSATFQMFLQILPEICHDLSTSAKEILSGCCGRGNAVSSTSDQHTSAQTPSEQASMKPTSSQASVCPGSAKACGLTSASALRSSGIHWNQSLWCYSETPIFLFESNPPFPLSPDFQGPWHLLKSSQTWDPSPTFTYQGILPRSTPCHPHLKTTVTNGSLGSTGMTKTEPPTSRSVAMRGTVAPPRWGSFNAESRECRSQQDPTRTPSAASASSSWIAVPRLYPNVWNYWKLAVPKATQIDVSYVPWWDQIIAVRWPCQDRHGEVTSTIDCYIVAITSATLLQVFIFWSKQSGSTGCQSGWIFECSVWDLKWSGPAQKRVA